ncbi:MAG: hypothetical protein EBR82_29440 [Caulobacteraceae bacterium]|nr:hypothetical protein [Caulobacteraceae bacterium]
MDHFHLDQAGLRRITGWSKRKASDLVTGTQRYNRDVLNEASSAMHLAPFELLMHPDDAYAIRNMRAEIERQAVRLVAERGPVFETQAPDPDRNSATG